ncbi:piggyBac transposable element-derived protein 4-like [Argopecten irradians]|uniref:piggyBac transposable element-derived protein 4-like n=1 Tax=Argopecten irradians TaxID=31199 RepID=UPI00371F6A2E
MGIPYWKFPLCEKLVKCPRSNRSMMIVNQKQMIMTLFSEESWHQGSNIPSTFTFTGNAGIQDALHLQNHDQTDFSYLKYFESIVSPDVVEDIVTETNRYATQYLQNHPNLSLHSRLRKWTPVSVAEMKVFLGMTIAMGLVKQASLHDYWSTDAVISTPFFGKVMPRDRFLAIMSFLHLTETTTDNSEAPHRGQEGYSPLQKSENPIKMSLKMSKKMSRREGQLAPQSSFRITYDLVMRLIGPYLNQGYHLYMDNYFSSPHLFYNLYLNATLAFGTVRSNRRGI